MDNIHYWPFRGRLLVVVSEKNMGGGKQALLLKPATRFSIGKGREKWICHTVAQQRWFLSRLFEVNLDS